MQYSIFKKWLVGIYVVLRLLKFDIDISFYDKLFFFDDQTDHQTAFVV